MMAWMEPLKARILFLISEFQRFWVSGAYLVDEGLDQVLVDADELS